MDALGYAGQQLTCGFLIFICLLLAAAALGYMLVFPQARNVPCLDAVIMAAGAILSIAACLWENSVAHNIVSQLMIIIGDASYSIYLSHGFIITIIFKLVSRISPHFSVALFTLIVCATAIPFGILVNRLIEIPVTQKLRGYAKLPHHHRAFIG